MKWNVIYIIGRKLISTQLDVAQSFDVDTFKESSKFVGPFPATVTSILCGSSHVVSFAQQVQFSSVNTRLITRWIDMDKVLIGNIVKSFSTFIDWCSFYSWGKMYPLACFIVLFCVNESWTTARVLLLSIDLAKARQLHVSYWNSLNFCRVFERTRGRRRQSRSCLCINVSL